VTSLAVLLIGFSLFSALTIALTHFRGEQYQGQTMSKTMGLVLLLALAGLQLAHFCWLYLDLEWVATIAYRMTLFTVAPAFFLFSRPLISPRNHSAMRLPLLGHAVPVLVSPFLPKDLAFHLAFVIGSGYLLWLARSLYALRRERVNFRLEMLMLGTVFLIAIGVSGLGLVQTALPGKLFFSLYASAIGLAFFLVQMTLTLRPRLNIEVIETAQASYTKSTLDKIECDTVLAQLNALMTVERIYIDPDLSLPKLAQRLNLSTHQLSELLNSRLGKSFSRYLRELRVAAAKTMLRDEASASVLSVGLNAGFTSQSNFYEAFREIEGMTPGQFRKLNLKGAPGK